MIRFVSARRLLAHVANSLNRFSQQLGQAGAIALVTAICAPILVMIVGFVIDFSYASYINQRLARATDAATLGSVSQTAATAAGGYGNLTFLQTMGTNYFNANVAQLDITGAKFSLVVTSDGAGGVVASGSYSYNVPTFFAGILGIQSFPISGNAKTSARPLVYVNYYILVDTSQSMGIAATQSDMNLLYNRVVANGNATTSDPGCVFGCHVKGSRSFGGTQPYTNEDLAHNLTRTWGARINLRIDAAISAIQGIISTAGNVAATTQNIKFALYAIQLDPTTNNLITEIAPLSANYSSLVAAAGTIELGNNVAGGFGDSDFQNELAAFNAKMTNSTNGSGASATSPLNYVFIVTDGLSDVCQSSHCTGAINASYCTQLKAKATVGTIYTTFGPIYNGNNPNATLNSDFVRLVKPYTMPVDKIAQSLQSCATSSDYAFQATDGPDIVAAMQALFLKTQPLSARITN